MKVCIARNAEARTNASLARVSDALCGQVDSICLLTRNRYIDGGIGVRKTTYVVCNKEIDNYEITLRSNPGKGLTNVFQLLLFQAIVFFWLFRNRGKYDIIHAFDLDVGLPAYLLSKLIPKKYVYHVADFYVDSRKYVPAKLKNMIRKIEYKVINNAVSTIVCTEERIKQIEGSKPKNITVIHNTPFVAQESLDTSLGCTEAPPLKNRIIFTYVGGLGESRFIRSAIEVIKDYPQILLNLAGMGTLSSYVEGMSLKHPNINYYGMLSYTDSIALYNKTDFIFAIYDPTVPNHQFSAPNKIYEAMMLGKPIVVAKNTGMDKIVNDNQMGYVILYSQESFREFIDNLIHHKLDWEKLGKNARDAYGKYSWAKMKTRLIGLYEQISEN